ncbi:hypothetical protein ACETK8_05945 [Brevundimonas staleyi]|uniref:PIN domain-containing protein n=1 Tax=Brevundimonas staleyi TaxID=74326 RepID=A0ABW0FLZ9_9CAUL
MRKVLLDANLIVLLVVGNVGRERISKHKRLSAYRAEDWDLLMEVLAGYEQIVLTPNVLTEASNLIRSGDKSSNDGFSIILQSLTVDAAEEYVASRDVVIDSRFPRLGLADVATLGAIDAETTLLTTDLGLFLAALGQGSQATNFNHLRDVS